MKQPAAPTAPAQLLLAAAPGHCVLAGQPARELAPRDAALLAWLAVEGPTPRARLAALLWPESDTEAARNALRQRLFQLRRQIGIDLVEGQATLTLARGLQHDLADADMLLGDTGAELGDEMHTWLQQQRRQRTERAAARQAEAADAAERAYDYDGALVLARQLLQQDRASERSHQRVMRLHYLRGDRAAALLAFDECEQLLKHEVGARPGAETLALLAMIESAQIPTAAAPAPLRSLPPAVMRPPRLVARADSVAQVLAPLAQGQHVLLLADAGMGKTRLMEECAAALAAQGRSVARVGARPGDAARSFALLARVLQELVPEPQALPAAARAALAWAVPAFGPTPSAALEAGPFEAAVAHVLSGAGVLLVDDLHYADGASIELLLRCCAEPVSLRWMMAVRPAEIPAALQAWRAGASVELQPAEVALRTLDEAGIAALLDSLAVPGLAGAALASALARHTGGNPQFVLETVKALLLEGGAQAFASGALPLPRTVGRLIHQRLRQLTAAALKLARLAAVAGQDLSPAMAAQVLGQDLLDLADPWAELEAAGVLRGTAFAHDLVSEGTLETMPQVLAGTLHEAVASWLQSHEGEPGRIAIHLQAAGQDRAAVPWLMRAAAHASARIQLRDAARLCEQAADICQREGDASGELAALEAAVDALFDVELGPHMESLLARLQGLTLDDAERARALRCEAAVRHFKLEDDRAEALGREALRLAMATGQRALEFRVRYGLVQVLSHRRDLAASQAVLEPIRDWVQREADAVQRLQFQCMDGWVLLASERFEPAIQVWQQVAQQAALLERPRDQAMALNHLQVCWSLMGRFDAGHEAGLHEQRIVHKHRLGGTRIIYLDLNLSISALLLGRYRESLAALTRAESSGVPDQATLHLRRAAFNLQMGQPARALNELQPLLDGRVPAQVAVRFNATLLHARWLAAHSELTADARLAAQRQALAQATELAAQTKRVDHAARVALLRGRLAEAGEGVARLTEAVVMTHRHGLRGMEAAAHALLARALMVAGDKAKVREHIETALSLRDQGHVTDQMPGVELEAIAIELLSRLDPPRAAALLAQAVAWVRSTVAAEVPDALQHGFLHVHPVHRALMSRANTPPDLLTDLLSIDN